MRKNYVKSKWSGYAILHLQEIQHLFKMKKEDKMLTYHQTTENEKYEINDWKYSGDYAIYNNPPYAEQKSSPLL